MFEKVSYDTFKDALISHGGATLEESDIEYMYNQIKLPERSTKNSAGYDFFSPIGLTVPAGACVIIPTGIKCNLKTTESDENGQIGKFLALYPRSSYGFKYGMRLMNTVGIIDEDYYNNQENEGHIMVAINTMNEFKLNFGDKFCQGIVQPYYKLSGEAEVETTRQGGIGSTDNTEEA